MTQLRHIYLDGAEMIEARASGAGPSSEAQLENAVAACRAALAGEGLSPTQTVLTRLWMRDRESGATLNEARNRLLRNTFRTASSSFFSRGRTPERAMVTVEFYALRTKAPSSRRIIEFDPPRRYAHYLVVDDWLVLSGMAEEAPTMDEQFDRSFAQVQAALDAEGFKWSDVISANLFLERGKADRKWLLDRFRMTAPLSPAALSLEIVDGLANTPKHLEIEIIAKRRSNL
jgi:enamine deaminase RidA (YjgF/YER057c/UK114 family)